MLSRVAVMAMRGSRGAGQGRGYGRGSYGRGAFGRGGGRHPSHLKGKEIGLFYRNRGMLKKKQKEKAERAVVGISESTKSDLDSLLHEVKKEQGATDMPMSSGSGVSGIFSHVSHTLPTSHKCLSRDPTLDAALQHELKETHEKSLSSYRKLQEFRRTLPCYSMQEEIVSKIRDNQVIVLVGETGCGKTTQIPQFILDDAISRGCGSATHVVCTQPRRISAISVAARVSEERGESPSMTNGSVGHQIRLETRLPRPQGSILYCTTGVMIRWLISTPLLDNCSHIVLDEVHERDVLIDFLMIIIRDLLPKRPDLKLIIMSATLHAELLSQYFSNCPIIQVPGRVFPVTIHHIEELLPEMRYKPLSSGHRKPFYGGRKRGQYSAEEAELEEFNHYVSTLPANQQEYLSAMSFKSIDHDLVVHTVKHLYHTTQDGAILVFLPGWTDISQVHDKIMKDPVLSCHIIIPLHSMLPMASQKVVFDRPPPGLRKIILSTSIAETSITIDDVVYVVDTGKTKEGTFDVARNIACLDPVWVSQASAKQRQGRAGRVQSGHCFRLYTRWHYDRMLEYQLPEMLRTSLEELVLQIKMLRLGSAAPFLQKALQPPKPDAVTMAIEKLTYLQALNSNEELTALGYHLAKLPINPSIGKAILFGAILSCLDPVLTICAVLGFKDPFVIPLHKQKEADTARRQFAGESRSDHVAYYNAYKEWERSGEQRSFCWRNFLSHNTLEMIKKNKRQFAELLMEIGFLSSPNPTDPSSNVNSRNLQLTKAVLCAGLYPNVATIVRKGGRPRNPSRPPKPPNLYTENDGRVHLHPKSVNCGMAEFSSKHLIYYIKVKSSKIFIHDCTMVTPFPLLFFGGDLTASKDEEQEIIQVDKRINFQASANIAQLVKELKAQLNSLLEQKIANPLLDFSSGTHSSKLIQAIIELICNEDTSQVQHFPNVNEQAYLCGLRRHSDRYFQYPDSDSEDEKYDDTKFQ